MMDPSLTGIENDNKGGRSIAINGATSKYNAEPSAKNEALLQAYKMQFQETFGVAFDTYFKIEIPFGYLCPPDGGKVDILPWVAATLNPTDCPAPKEVPTGINEEELENEIQKALDFKTDCEARFFQDFMSLSKLASGKKEIQFITKELETIREKKSLDKATITISLGPIEINDPYGSSRGGLDADAIGVKGEAFSYKIKMAYLNLNDDDQWELISESAYNEGSYAAIDLSSGSVVSYRCPSFITLGHELIHCLNALEAISMYEKNLNEVFSNFYKPEGVPAHDLPHSGNSNEGLAEASQSESDKSPAEDFFPQNALTHYVHPATNEESRTEKEHNGPGLKPVVTSETTTVFTDAAVYLNNFFIAVAVQKVKEAFPEADFDRETLEKLMDTDPSTAYPELLAIMGVGQSDSVCENDLLYDATKPGNECCKYFDGRPTCGIMRISHQNAAAADLSYPKSRLMICRLIKQLKYRNAYWTKDIDAEGIEQCITFINQQIERDIRTVRDSVTTQRSNHNGASSSDIKTADDILASSLKEETKQADSKGTEFLGMENKKCTIQ